MALVARLARSSRKIFTNSKQCSILPKRCLNLQEYQSKKLMQDHGVNVQEFKIAETAQQAETIASNLKVREYVIKAQILAGGRGKGTFDHGFKGGVQLTKDPTKVSGLVKEMLGHRLTTKQTLKDGVLVNKVMVAEALDIERETYFAILMDREYNGPVLVASPEGGVDIEEVADRNPDAIFKMAIDIYSGLTRQQAEEMAKNLQFTGDKLKEAADQIERLYQLFINVDASQVEVNPFGETPDGRVVCFDAKINFDDNAEYRQQEIFAMDDQAETDQRELEAGKHNLNYVGMEGNIGCLVNGAGLAMATMDIVKLHKGEPANFLDMGGGVTEEGVFHAFKILSGDPQVKVILVNVFGGIVNTANVARGIIRACEAINLKLPVVIRLEGTNVDEAREIIRNSGFPITMAADFEDVAVQAVARLP